MNSTSPVRVLHVLGRLSPGGGVQIVVRRLAAHVDPNEVELHIQTVRPLFEEDNLDEVNAQMYGIGHTRGGYRVLDRIKVAFAVARKVHQVRPEVVQLHSGTAWLGILARLTTSRPVFMIEVHDAPDSGRHSRASDRFEGWWVRRFGAVAICHSTSVAADIERLWSPPEANVVMFPLAVDSATFSPIEDAEQRERWRTSHGLGDDEFVIIAVGRYVPSKRFADLLEVLAGLADRGVKAKLVIVGKTPEPNPLESRAKELRVSDDVTYAGVLYDGDLADAIRAADALVSASIYEGFGLTLVEAMACGVPVVTMSVGGVTDLVDDGRTGWLIEPGDFDAFTNRLAELSENPDQRAEFGAAGRDRVLARFTIANLARSFTDLYWDRARPESDTRSRANGGIRVD